MQSSTGILIQREGNGLERIYLPQMQSKKLKNYVEKISGLNMKGKLAGTDSAEIVVSFTNAAISPLWEGNTYWQRA